MGVAINVLMGTNVVVAVLLLTQRFASPAFGWSLRWGVAITVLGMAQAILMTLPTAQQLAGWEAGAPVTLVGAHSVGAPDGLGANGAGEAAGMPVTGWRTDAGDLRVGHFVGLHALQVLPLVGAVLGRRRLGERQRAGLVHVAAAGYLGLDAAGDLAGAARPAAAASRRLDARCLRAAGGGVRGGGAGDRAARSRIGRRPARRLARGRLTPRARPVTLAPGAATPRR